MKRGLFLLATATLSSALYAQQTFTRKAVEDVLTQYNPQFMHTVGQNPQVQLQVDAVMDAYARQQLPDTLENRYTLIALTRNFENSILLNTLTKQYQRALLYAQLGDPETQRAARTAARKKLSAVYARIWAVSVQVKEDLLKKYKQAHKEIATRPDVTAAQRQELQDRYQKAITFLKADIKQLRAQPGRQVQYLTAQALTTAEAEVQAALSLLETGETANLQIKTNHKKPVAE